MDCWTNIWGEVTFGVPPNINGHGYVCWVREGNYQPNQPRHFSTTQTFFGGPQYDIGPATNKEYILPFPITCDQGAYLAVSFTADRTGWGPGSGIRFDVLGPDGSSCAGGALGLGLPGPSAAVGVSEAGVHKLRVVGTLLPTAGASFAMKVTYTAPKEVTP
jgi:hypothetical protein